MQHRSVAIRRGVEFIYQRACEDDVFAQHGNDLVFCFAHVYRTAADQALKTMAKRMGRDRARLWRQRNKALASDIGPDELLGLIYGSYAADVLGVRDKAFKIQLADAASTFSAEDYFGFNPRLEAPPVDISDVCVCETQNPRGRTVCRRCNRPLERISRYWMWCYALIGTHLGDRYGFTLGARYSDVVEWLPLMRPYPSTRFDVDVDARDCLFALTHLVYTLNDYSVYRLSREWLPLEFQFMKQRLSEAIALQDVEMVGELLDALAAFGVSNRHIAVRQGKQLLLQEQRDDGSWGGGPGTDTYDRYHTTWTAIDGLREHQWRGERLSFPRLARRIEQMNVEIEGAASDSHVNIIEGP